MTNPRVKLTVDDYLATPDDPRCQLLDGDLILAPAPTYRHTKISFDLAKALDRFVVAHHLGTVSMAPTDIILSENDVVQPDFFFVSTQRIGIIAERVHGAPDLVVEVLSPSTADQDLGPKRGLYQRHGVQEYWLVDPDANTIEVLTASETAFITAATYTQGGVLTSPLLEGLSIDLAPIFAE